VISSTMQDFPLTIAAVLRHGQNVYAGAECVTWTESGPRRATYGTIAANASV
jgi:fatty-acyl-CoA synthase